MKVAKQIEALIILLTIHTFSFNKLIQTELLSLEYFSSHEKIWEHIVVKLNDNYLKFIFVHIIFTTHTFFWRWSSSLV